MMGTRGMLLALALVCGTAAQAQAQCGGGQLWGSPYSYSYRYIHTDRQIPYFAEFPPVYYSYPVPRTYGYSPYAYLPNVMTPDVEFLPQPLDIINPHVPPQGEVLPPQDEQAARQPAQIEPLVVINPYVEPSATLAGVDAGR